MKKLVLFGAGPMAELAHYYFERDAGRKVAGFCIDAAFLKSGTFAGLPVVPFEEAASAFPPAGHDLFVAVGYAELNRLRARKVGEAKAKGYAIASYCSSRAFFMADAPPGENCLVTERTVVQPFVHLGNNVTLFGSYIGHHAVIGDDCFVAVATVGGGTRVETGAFIGNNASVGPNVTIGERCLVGAGAVVLRDLPPSSVVASPPARHSRVPGHRLPKF